MKRFGIGGSDTPTILGQNPYQTPLELWEQKTGRRGDQEITPAMQRGTVLEPVAAEIYAQKTGRKLRRVNTLLRHADHEWLTGNIDREIVNDDRGPGVLEIKCPGLNVFGKAKREGLPAAYNLQLAHYLAVSRRKWGAFAVFNAEKWELIFFDVDRDEGLIDIIIAQDAAFYQCVLDDTPPIESISPALDLPPIEPIELVTMDSPAWREAIERLQEAREIRAEAEALENEAKQSIQQIMTETGATVAQGAGARIYYRMSDGRTTIDSKRLAREHPEIFAKYAKTGSPFRTFKPYFLRGESL
jgi:putative phage-type endonuclease